MSSTLAAAAAMSFAGSALVGVLALVLKPMSFSQTIHKSGGEWKEATATYYTSYPRCCPESPNYDPKANTDECKHYSGCKYIGRFMGYDGKMSFSEVQRRNIADFYDLKNQRNQEKTMKWWHGNIRGKSFWIRHPKTGKTMKIEALDSCLDSDCSGCCSKNASDKGYLVDLEENTAKRFWGKNVPGTSTIQWKWA